MFGVPTAFRSVLGFAQAKRFELAILGLSLLIGLYPFASLYLPRLIESGPQPLSEAFGPGRSQHVWDLIAVGTNNYFWSDLLGNGGLGGRILWNPSITPLFGVAMLGSIVAAFVCFRLADLRSDELTRVLFVRVFGIAALLLLMSFVDWEVIQPYVFYYRFIPGGSAMRVPSRLVLLFPAVWGADRGDRSVLDLATRCAFSLAGFCRPRDPDCGAALGAPRGKHQHRARA